MEAPSSPDFASAFSQHPDAAVAAGELIGQIDEQLGLAPSLVLIVATPNRCETAKLVGLAFQSLAGASTVLIVTTSGVLGGAQAIFESGNSGAISVLAGAEDGPKLVGPDHPGWHKLEKDLSSPSPSSSIHHPDFAGYEPCIGQSGKPPSPTVLWFQTPAFSKTVGFRSTAGVAKLEQEDHEAAVVLWIDVESIFINGSPVEGGAQGLLFEPGSAVLRAAASRIDLETTDEVGSGPTAVIGGVSGSQSPVMFDSQIAVNRISDQINMAEIDNPDALFVVHSLADAEALWDLTDFLPSPNMAGVWIPGRSRRLPSAVVTLEIAGSS